MDTNTGFMKFISTFLFLVFISSFLYAQDGSVVWAKQLGAGSSLANNSALAMDASGNLYFTGTFNGTLDFNPDPSLNNSLISNGKNDIYVSKYDANGNFIWAKNFGGSAFDYGNAITLDPSGNIYITGGFEGTVDFNPDPSASSILTSAGSSDIVILKLDAAGNFVWAKQLGGVDDEDDYSLTVDAIQNVYVTGTFSGSSDFDPNPAVHFDLTSAGGTDAFVCKLDVSGNFIWAKQLGGSLNDYSYSVAVDGSGNVYTTGGFRGTADLNPGAGTSLFTSAGETDIFISKLDATGNFVWAKQLGSTDFDNGVALFVNAEGVYVTGKFSGTVDLNPGAGTSLFTSAGDADIFISKLDATGNFIWAKQLGGTFYDYPLSVTVDGSGNVYTTGGFSGTADFNSDPSVTNELTSNGEDDVFISKLDGAGNFVWAKDIGGIEDDYANTIAVDASGNVFTSGQFKNIVDFDPGSGVYSLTAFGEEDIFFSKLNASGDFVFAKQTGNAGGSSDFGKAVATDALGNIYTTGYFNGTADFNPDPSAMYNLTSNNYSVDIFISKLDATGNFVWAKKIGGIDDDQGISIATDAMGNVYATGSFKGTVDFDPDPAVTKNLTSKGLEDVYIIKFNPAGNFVWVKQIGGTSSDIVTSITVDGLGNVYTTGNFSYTVDFNPDPAVTNNLASVGMADIFISKLDAAGNFVWAKQISGSDYEYPRSIKIDGTGNFLYICGSFFYTVDFNPDPAITNNLTSAGSYDMFISKLDASGNFVWAKQLGSTGPDQAIAISVDGTGNVYTTGYFRNTVDFDPDPTTTYNLVASSFSSSNIFVSKLDGSGNFVWAKNFGSPGYSDGIAWSIAVDAASNVYTTGSFDGVLDFNPDASGEYNLTALGYKDIFISKLDALGDFVWAKQIGGSLSNNVGNSLSLDNDDNLIVTGSFEGLADFDPDPAIVNNLSAIGSSDIFVIKLSTEKGGLPVSLINFEAKSNGCTALLQWETASEHNSLRFEIQQSADGSNFKTVGIAAASGNSNQKSLYNFRYDLINQENYFRLRMVDKDGSSKMSSVVNVKSNCNNQIITIFPNPAKHSLTLQGLEEKSNLQIIDALGKIVIDVRTTGNKETLNITVLPVGTYLLRVSKNNKLVKTLKFVKE